MDIQNTMRNVWAIGSEDVITKYDSRAFDVFVENVWRRTRCANSDSILTLDMTTSFMLHECGTRNKKQWESVLVLIMNHDHLTFVVVLIGRLNLDSIDMNMNFFFTPR